MANRVAITVLGSTNAPYGNLTPPLVNSGLSEEVWHLDVGQLQRGVDTTLAQQAQYPLALSRLTVKFVEANHFNTSVVFITISAGDLDALANS